MFVGYIQCCRFFVCDVFFFFFKQKTAYEMRISDWSSDVCSSDLPAQHKPEKTADPWMTALSAKRKCRQYSEAISNTRIISALTTHHLCFNGHRLYVNEKQSLLSIKAIVAFR